MAIDFKNPRLYTTAIGAAAGVALTRKIVPKKQLTVGKQLLGGGIGGGLGYVAGDVYAALPPSPTGDPIKDRKALARYYQLNPDETGEISAELLKLHRSAFPEDFKHKYYNKTDNIQRDNLVSLSRRANIQEVLGQERAAKMNKELAKTYGKGPIQEGITQFGNILHRVSNLIGTPPQHGAKPRD